MSESRAPRCEICGELESHKVKWGGRKALAFDHCHKTNRQRGRLCTRCNTGIGSFRDDPRLLLNAMEYLRKYRSDLLLDRKLVSAGSRCSLRTDCDLHREL
jgi:hypothetical protein